MTALLRDKHEYHLAACAGQPANDQRLPLLQRHRGVEYVGFAARHCDAQALSSTPAPYSVGSEGTRLVLDGEFL